MNNTSFLKAIAAFSALPRESVKLAALIAEGMEDGPRENLFKKLLVAEARMRVLQREEKECSLTLESLMHTAKRDIRMIEEESSVASDEGQKHHLESLIHNTK